MSPELKKSLMTMFLLVVSYTAIAQDVVTDRSYPPPPPGPDGRIPNIPALPGLAVPIDENIVILVILGLAMGITYFFRKRFSKSLS